MTEAERRKKDDRGLRENGAREKKISYARGQISYRTQLGIEQRPEKFMEESKFQGGCVRASKSLHLVLPIPRRRSMN